ncbi:MAG TPA: hypothetical protein VHV82_16975 [Sporichthyaceae bacterium]|jgi:hypothetical protein|nr:hypothetical protein [Sporichthyaceae bacterium]
MAENSAAIPELTQMGEDAEQVAALYPRGLPPTSDAWKAFPVEIPAGLNKLAEGHCGYDN